MKKSIFTLLIIVSSLFSEELTQSETLKVDQELLQARQNEAEAKFQIAVAKKKLLEAQKIIKKREAQHLTLTSHTELGYVSTSGNTNTKTYSLDATGKMKLLKNSLQLDIDYIYSEESLIENKNKLATELNYDYRFSKYFAFNYLGGYKDDKFSGFNYQIYTGPGIKYIAIENDIHTLNFKSNILYSSDAEMDKYYDALGNEIKYPYIDPSKDLTASTVIGKTSEYSSFLLTGNYEWKITEALKFIQDLSYRTDITDNNIYFVNSKTGFLSKINATFSMGANYKIDYVNVPPIGNEYMDKALTVTFNIDF